MPKYSPRGRGYQIVIEARRCSFPAAIGVVIADDNGRAASEALKDLRRSWAKAPKDAGLQFFWIYDLRHSPSDALTGVGLCGSGATALPGFNAANAYALGRCSYGPRPPMLVISPYARRNFVDHTVTDQSSAIHFIEDNWLGGQRIGQGSFDGIAGSISQMFDFTTTRKQTVLFLNPSTGERE